MQICSIKQGTEAWKKLRLKKFTASEAAAMMGCGWISRDELLFQKKTGIEPEIGEQAQKRFSDGHAAEAKAGPIIEEMLGTELYPAVATHDEHDWMLASFDGIDMLETVVFEHKLWSEGLAESVRNKNLPQKYYWQLEQQLLVSGAEKAVFVVSDGTKDNMEHMNYYPVPGRSEELIAGWKQFMDDLEGYEVKESQNLPSATIISALPDVTYQRNGLTINSDLGSVKQQAAILIDRAKTPMITDQDFADGKSLVDVFSKAEKVLKAVADRVIAEVSDINQFRSDLLGLAEQVRQARLDTDKRVKAEMAKRKSDIQGAAKRELDEYIFGLELSINELQIPRIDNGIIAATKGKRTLDSFQGAANDAVAKAKIAYRSLHDIAQKNLGVLSAVDNSYRMLFADIQQIAFKEPSDFKNLIQARISEYKDQQEQARRAEEAKKTEEDPKQEAARQGALKRTVKQDEGGHTDSLPPLNGEPCVSSREETSPPNLATEDRIFLSMSAKCYQRLLSLSKESNGDLSDLASYVLNDIAFSHKAA